MVANSRLQKRSNTIWRRRKCLNCGNIFTTHESIALQAALMVKKRSDRLEPFDRDKLFLAIYESCKHRPKAIGDASDLTEIIISNMLTNRTNGIIAISEVVAAAHTALLRFDKTSAAIYAAYHLD
jgi:transcriptional repressor NrdR